LAGSGVGIFFSNWNLKIGGAHLLFLGVIQSEFALWGGGGDSSIF